jgi:hypothetical protein
MPSSIYKLECVSRLTSDELDADLLADEAEDVSVEAAEAAAQGIDGRKDAIRDGAGDGKDDEEELADAVNDQVECSVRVRPHVAYKGCEWLGYLPWLTSPRSKAFEKNMLPMFFSERCK